MRKLLALFLLATSVSSNAMIPGGFNTSKAEIEAYVLSYQAPHTVTMTFDINDKANARYNTVHSYIDVEDYIALFHTDENVDGSYDEHLTFQASTKGSVRTVTVVRSAYDDSNNLAAKEVVTLKLSNEKASMQIEAYRRKTILGVFTGKLKKVYTGKVKNLKAQKGVALYGDNRGHLIGKVKDLDTLRDAAANNSGRSLSKLCQMQCQK